MPELPYTNSRQQQPLWRSFPALNRRTTLQHESTHDSIEVRHGRRHPQPDTAACHWHRSLPCSARIPRAPTRATGVDTALGNALNPPGQTTVPRPLSDEDIDTWRRSPTGQLSTRSPMTAPRASRPDGGWTFNRGRPRLASSTADGAKNALFRKYKDSPPAST